MVPNRSSCLHQSTNPMVLALALMGCWSIGAQARTPAAVSQLCEAAAVQAAEEVGVPPEILLALSLTESGRNVEGQLRPWPWVINLGGKGHWFDSPDALHAAAATALAEGRSNFDLGCFQLNHRWHAQGFSSLDSMIDPAGNARYAARFLRSLYAESGDWGTAAAAYHSRTPVHADRYRARFETILAQVRGGSGDPGTVGESPVAITRTNRYPLLQAGLRGGGGSLVPLQNTPQPLFGG